VSPLKVAKVDGASDPTFIPEDGFSEEDSPWLTEDGIGPVIK
jgi:hypothetical protein